MNEEVTERLVKALFEASAPRSMIDRAMLGRYDSTEMDISMLPTKTLVDDAIRYRLRDIALRAVDGEFDCRHVGREPWGTRRTFDYVGGADYREGL